MLDTKSYLESLVKEGPAVPYMVQLLFDQPLSINKVQLLTCLRKYCGNVQAVDSESEVLAFSHLDHLCRFQEGEFPAKCLITPVVEKTNLLELLGASLLQTWDWDQAADVALGCHAVWIVSDAMAVGLTRQIRLSLFHGVIRSLVELLPVAAIHWIPSQRIVDPHTYPTRLDTDGPLITAAVNVRVFQVEKTAGEKVMDTMGLAAFGLSDLQCHFAGLDSVSVAYMLLRYASYLFEKGEIIQDGHTVEGLDPSERWRCQHEESLVPPLRRVLDIQPGKYSPPR